MKITFAILALTLLCLCAIAADIKIGESRDSVVQKMGNPTVSAPAGNREFCEFTRGSVDFVDGKVAAFKLFSEDEIKAQKEREEKARVLQDEIKVAAERDKKAQEEAIRRQQEEQAELSRQQEAAPRYNRDEWGRVYARYKESKLALDEAKRKLEVFKRDSRNRKLHNRELRLEWLNDDIHKCEAAYEAAKLDYTDSHWDPFRTMSLK